MATSLQSPQSSAAPHVLDNAVWAALTGPHEPFAERVGQAARYAPDISPFTAVADADDPRSWADLAELTGPGVVSGVMGPQQEPAGWEVLEHIRGVRLVATSLRVAPDSQAVRLGPDDLPEMLALVELTKPGPFLPRTPALGGFLGIRHAGRLIAMAGERMRPPGWTEISGVCTAPAHRGRGLATRLIRAVAAGIEERGDTPFIQATAANVGAIRLYESMGFTHQGHADVLLVRSPGGAPQ